jgi:hypothetical protein
MRTATRIGFVPAAALVVLLIAGGGMIAGAVSAPTVPDPHPVKEVQGGPGFAGGQVINDPAATAPGFQRNAKGLTFGSAADAPRPDLEPDLIWVVTLEGGSGYVYKKDLDRQPPTAAQAQAGSDAYSKGRILTAYASDGTTPVGTFQVGGSDASADAGDN